MQNNSVINFMPKVKKLKLISIYFDIDMIAKLKLKSEVRNMKYQTFLKMILTENVDKY